MRKAASVSYRWTSNLAAPSPQPLPSFNVFSELFVEEALRVKGFAAQSEFIVRALEYAKPLLDAQLPVIFNEHHFCKLVGYKNDFVERAAASPSLFYRRFIIEKKNGKLREISEPLPSLKEIQGWIYQQVLRRVSVSPAAKAFVPGKNLKDSSRFHIGQKFVLRIDIKDFFPSVTRRRVFGLFRSLGYSSKVSGLMSRLCCLNDSLPQGGVCSPYISNLIVRNLDSRLLAFCKSRNLRYTRYADDFTVSGKKFSYNIVNFIKEAIREEGFDINEEKTSVMRSASRQTVVGVVVNKRQNAPREFRRKIRQHEYFVRKYGIDGHLAWLGEHRSGAREYYLGKIAFSLMLNPKDRDALRFRDLLLYRSPSQ